jgi:hypothetical protein
VRAISTANYTSDELREALQPIASLISKSEKAQQKLTVGTWQHTMLQDSLNSLHIASTLIRKESDVDNFSEDDFQKALSVIASMISKTEKAQTKFILGTSQNSLLRNRLKALRISETLIKAEQSAAANP